HPSIAVGKVLQPSERLRLAVPRPARPRIRANARPMTLQSDSQKPVSALFRRRGSAHSILQGREYTQRLATLCQHSIHSAGVWLFLARSHQDHFPRALILSFAHLLLNHLDQFADALLIRMLLPQVSANARYNVCVVIGSRYNIENFFVRILLRHYE